MKKWLVSSSVDENSDNKLCISECKELIVKNQRFLIILFLIMIFLSFSVYAIGSTNYNITNPTISSGADNSSSANYKTGIIIEDFSANSSSSSYKSFFGFYYTFGSVNSVPNNPIVLINSTDGSNKTLQDLNCFANITDPDSGNKLNVSVRWHRNFVLNLTLDYNNSYVNGSFFNAVLDDANTTKGENWSCSLRLFDGNLYSNWTNSINPNNITILNTLPVANLISPANENITTNRTPAFTWNGQDDDNDILQYEINISLIPKSTCTDNTNRYIEKTTLGGNTSYIVTNYLKCLSDNNDKYNWTVRAYDGEGFGNWTGVRNISVQSDISISLPVNSVNFGAMNITKSDNTADDSPAPLILRNDGNAEINVTVNFTDLFSRFANPSKYFQFKIRNLTNSCFNYASTVISWTNATAPSLTGHLIHKLNFTNGYQDGCNNASIDILVEVPADEPPGNKSSIIVFTSSLGENYPTLP